MEVRPMGWVSMNEDIEELRHQRAHFKSGFENLLRGVRERRPDSLKQAQLEEIELTRLWDRVKEFLEDIQENVLHVFDEAERRLSDPSVRIVKRLDKKTAEIENLRKRVERSETELARCRETRARLQEELENISREASSLREEIAWRREVSGAPAIIRPALPRGRLQDFPRFLGSQRLALFELAQIAPTDLSLIGEIVLR
jgi:chromosome segregation ATPase